MAALLTTRLGLVPGGRVLLRSANNPTKVALYLAVIKAGGIVVATMPLLRARELVPILDKARIALCLCDQKLADALVEAAGEAALTPRIVTWTGTAGGELGALLAVRPRASRRRRRGPTIPACSASPPAPPACRRRRSTTSATSW